VPEELSGSAATSGPWTSIRRPRYRRPSLSTPPSPSGRAYAVNVFGDLKSIQQPTLVVNGDHDIMLPTINSYILSQHLPKAELVIYPDSGHGSLFPYPTLFVHHVSRFLGAEPAFS
jgi:pimeloyl-ACP methyl ester carboxylesterase